MIDFDISALNGRAVPRLQVKCDLDLARTEHPGLDRVEHVIS